MTASALDLSAEHLRQVEELYLRVRAANVDADAEGSPLALSREHLRRTKHLFLVVQKARRSPHTNRTHAISHAKRMVLETEWEQRLRLLSDHLVNGFDIDGAYEVARRAWITPADEPADGVFVDEFAPGRLAKALSKPKESDLSAVEHWCSGTPRATLWPSRRSRPHRATCT